MTRPTFAYPEPTTPPNVQVIPAVFRWRCPRCGSQVAKTELRPGGGVRTWLMHLTWIRMRQHERDDVSCYGASERTRRGHDPLRRERSVLQNESLRRTNYQAGADHREIASVEPSTESSSITTTSTFPRSCSNDRTVRWITATSFRHGTNNTKSNVGASPAGR